MGQVVEQRRGDHESFASTLMLKVKGKTEICVEGTLFGHRDPRITRVNQFQIEAVPAGTIIAIHNRDVPGVVGKVGTLLGDEKVNIGRIHLSRDKDRGEAFSMINLDSDPPPRVLEALKAIPGVVSVRQIRL